MLKKVIVSAIAALVLIGSTSVAIAQVEVHGFMQARTALANNDYTVRMDRFGLRLQQKIDDEFDWLTEIYVHPYPAATSTVYMESAYLNWHLGQKLPWDFNIRFGKGRNETFAQTPYYSRRRTSDYTLLSEAYTQSRVQGIQTFSNFGKVQIAIGILNPLASKDSSGTRQVPDMPTGDWVKVPFGDMENTDNTTDRIAFCGRLGFKDAVPVLGALNVGASAYVSEVGPGKDNEQNRFGVDGEFKMPCGFIAQGQYIAGSTCGEDHSGAEIMGGWEKGALGFYGRYGFLDYDDNYQGMNQVMLSAIYKIRPTVHLRLEGLINGEDKNKTKGWAEVDNDVLFFETLFAW